ncbi:MAG: S8 family serine peptidase [Phycisphaerales bacterium]|nr:S8 family serine peptidase [Phycisphaerales bacterium]
MHSTPKHLTMMFTLLITAVAAAKPDGRPTQTLREWAKTASAAELTAYDHEAGVLIVQLDTAKGLSAEQSLQTILRQTRGTLRYSSKLVPGLHVIDMNQSVSKGIQMARSRGNDVIYAQPSYTFTATATNDPQWSALWGLRNEGLDYPNPTGQVTSVDAVPGVDIRAEQAWQLQPHANGITVAVIDSSVDIHHEDLSAAIWNNQNEVPGNGIDDDGNGYVDDTHGWNFPDNAPTGPAENHGTHCSGTIAAVANNDLGISGVAPGASIMPLRFLIEGVGGDTAHAIQAIDYAVANGARISNNSWGGGAPSTALYETMAAAGAAGHLFVIATGNEGGAVSYPAAFDLDCIISVAAIRPDGQLAMFSNYGQGADLAAPGWGIVSCVANGYDTYQGTSMAAPHVAGVAALLLARSGGTATVAQLRQALLGSVRPMNSLNGLVETGGMLDAEAALHAIDNGGGDPNGNYGLIEHTAAAPSNMSATFDPTHGNWSICRDEGLTELPGGQGGTNLQLGDDDAAWVDFPAGFPFAGSQYDRVHVHSNGSVTLTESTAQDFAGTNEQFIVAPRIAPLFTDLDPSSGGSVNAQALADRLVVSWIDVPAFQQTEGNTMQAELFSDGRIRMSWLNVPAAAQQHIVGFGASSLNSQQTNLFQADLCDEIDTPQDVCTEDIDQSGRVDVHDLIRLLEAWGHCE